MNVLFRVDASLQTGTGHVVRCASLAQALAFRGAKITFACRSQPGHLQEWLRGKGFRVIDLRECPVDDMEWLTALSHRPYWMVVDHYGLDFQWETQAKRHAGKLLVIDDLANRPHHCDILLDQNRLDERIGEAVYRPFVPDNCRVLLGPRYALLRPEFAERHQHKLEAENWKREQRKLTLLVFFGGTDPTGETERLLPALKKLALTGGLQIKLVVGNGCPGNFLLREACQNIPNLQFLGQTDDMAELMSSADLSLTAGGATTWERLCLGLPGFVVVVAENQLELSLAVEQAGVQKSLGVSANLAAELIEKSGLPIVTPECVEAQVLALAKDIQLRRRMRQAGLEMVDGLGAERVAKVMLQEFQRSPVV